MDARDFNQEPPVVKDQKYLEKIYDLQMDLIEEYTKIEGNVAPPININTKKSQILLKDFTGRVIEELAEGFESLMEVHKLTKLNRYWSSSCSLNDFDQMMNHLQNAGEEMADAMHFMVELMIYANIHPEDVLAYINPKVPESDDTIPLHYNSIAKCMIYGVSYIRDTYTIPDSKNVLNLHRVYENFKEEGMVENNLDLRLYVCGKYYSIQNYILYKSLMWDVAYHLNIARNFLKNKPWKQSQMMTNEQGYQEELVKGFISLMGLYYQMGINDEDLYFLYFRKNLVNRFRIKSNY